MKRKNAVVTVLVVVSLFVFGLTSYAYGSNGFDMMRGLVGSFGDGAMSGYGNGMMGSFGGGMMGNGMGNAYQAENYTGDPLSDEEILENVEKYLENYKEELVVGDLFKFADSEYYVSIEEKETGLGAMELLVNPYTGTIRLEPGPNMMWNEKYGRMGSGMGAMMGNKFYSNNSNNAGEEISLEDAVKLANEELVNQDKDLIATEGGHQFYGYYTLHVEKNGEAYGMLSVNSYTGDVWYHSWHGELTAIAGGHEA